jgi:hypothetical protein
LQAVFTGIVACVEAGATGQTVLAHGAFALLGQSEVEGAYESVSADFIVKDLIGKAGATAGTVAKGPDLAAGRAPRPHRPRPPAPPGHAVRRRAVCRRGRQFHCAAPKTGSADIFKFGETITHLAVQKSPAFDSVEVWGEGAASAKGADKAHWLSTDLSGVSAKAAVTADGTVQAGKLGARPLRLRDGALRSGEAVEAVAKAWAAAWRRACARQP